MLNVVFASDNNYVPLLLIAATSLLENNSKDFDCINIYILDDGLSDSSKDRILKLKRKYYCKISFIKTKNLDSFDINISPLEKKLNRASFTTYARLFMSKLLPNDVSKIIYMDCDAIILGSFKELWMMDISDFYCAGVLDTSNECIQKLHGFGEDDSYFNAGFLLVNLDKWREDNVEEKFVEFLYENQGKFFLHDQGVINNVFRNKIKILEPKYNLQYFFQYYEYDLAKKFRGIRGEYYNKEILEDCQKNPIFVHFCGSSYDRPWMNKGHFYNKLFLKYAKMSNCEEIIQYIEAPSFKASLFYKGVNSKLIKFFLKLIPSKLVYKIIDKNGIDYFEKESLNAYRAFKFK